MKYITVFFLILISCHLHAQESCDVAKAPQVKKLDIKNLALKEISKVNRQKSYISYDIKMFESKVKGGKKDIGSVTFYYKKTKPLKINFFIKCDRGSYTIEDDYLN